MTDFLVQVNEYSFPATWTGENPGIRDALLEAMPIGGEAARWGDELYISTTLEIEPTVTKTTVSAGSLAYWPAGPAICLFWGPTPASTDATPKAASPVAVFAEVTELSPLQDISGGAEMTLTQPR